MVQTVKRPLSEAAWLDIRSKFNLHPGYIHLAASQFLASHPTPVREAIARHRDALDRDPVGWTLANENAVMDRVRIAAARYFGVPNPSDIAMTDSTTMGLGLLYGGLRLSKDDDILIPEDDYYSHIEAVHRCADRTGAKVQLLKLYERPSEATENGIVDAVLESVSDRTRVLGLSWVHSNTGIKTPIARIARELKRLNARRPAERRILFVVDGVHGFGVETMDIAEKRKNPQPAPIDGKAMTPGGFHSLEHRWALEEAFAFVESIGKEAIRDRVYLLNRRCKEGLRAIRGVTLHTPMRSEERRVGKECRL